jgi:thiol-disulfide isomerase/thioredoxin
MIIPLAITFVAYAQQTSLATKLSTTENSYRQWLRQGKAAVRYDSANPRVNVGDSIEFEALARLAGKEPIATKAWVLSLVSGKKDLARENRILDQIFAAKVIDRNQFANVSLWSKQIFFYRDTFAARTRAAKVIDLIIQKAPSKRQQAELLLDKADIMSAVEDVKWDIYNRLVADYAGTPASSEARRILLRKKNLQRGDLFPDFISKDSDGKTFRLTELRGKVVVLEFWANWCPSCQRTIPVMQGVEKQFAGQPVEFIGINSDGDSPVVKEIQAKWGMTTRTLVDGSPTGPISTRYAIMAWPSFFVIGKDGVVVYRSAGIDAEGLTNAISQASSKTL